MASGVVNPLATEEGRETLGAAICGGWFGFCVHFTKDVQHTGQLKTSPLIVLAAVAFAATPLTIWLFHWLLDIRMR